MNGWTPHWPTVAASIVMVFVVTFAKDLAADLAKSLVAKIFKRKKDADEPK